MYLSGARKRGVAFKALVCLLCASLLFISLPNLVFAGPARGNAGGGEVREFSIGDFLGDKILGFVTSGISGAVLNGGDFMQSGLSSLTSGLAASQTQRAIALRGAYYGWKPKKTFMLSSVIGGAVGGFTSSDTGADSGPAFSGAIMGAITGFVEALITIAIDGDKIDRNEQPGLFSRILSTILSTLIKWASQEHKPQQRMLASGKVEVIPAATIGQSLLGNILSVLIRDIFDTKPDTDPTKYTAPIPQVPGTGGAGTGTGGTPGGVGGNTGRPNAPSGPGA